MLQISLKLTIKILERRQRCRPRVFMFFFFTHRSSASIAEFEEVVLT